MKTIINTFLITVFISFASIFPSEAQITPDISLPNNTDIKIEGNNRIIEEGTQVGNNLFHSFQYFSIPTGNTVIFNNPLNIQNIITRVTGGLISNIDGLIKANGTANLYLMNPSGITFGANARLDIGGSFLATTANSIKFIDSIGFSATEPQYPPLLTFKQSQQPIQIEVDQEYVEAQGWKDNGNGTVSFTTKPKEVISYGSLSDSPCHNSQKYK